MKIVKTNATNKAWICITTLYNVNYLHSEQKKG